MDNANWQYLEPNPRSAYRQLFIKGTRIRAEVIYGMTVDGSEPMTPEEVAVDMNLPLEAVREAVAYCAADPPEVRADHEAEERLMKATGMDQPGGQYRVLSPQDRARLRL